MSTCNWLDLGTLGSQLVIMPKNIPDHFSSFQDPPTWAMKGQLLVQWLGRFLGIITGWFPSVCKSNRLHVDIHRFSFIKLGLTLWIPSISSVIFLQSSTSTGNFSNSMGSSVTNCRFSLILVLVKLQMKQLRNNSLRGSSLRTTTNHFREIYRINTNLLKKNQKMSICNSARLGNTTVLIDYSQKSLRTLELSETYLKERRNCGFHPSLRNPFSFNKLLTRSVSKLNLKVKGYFFGTSSFHL